MSPIAGPSFSINSSWASAVQGLEIAAKLVGTGACEAAIVTASNVIHFNSVEREYADMNFLAPEGKCLPFDSNGKNNYYVYFKYNELFMTSL